MKQFGRILLKKAFIAAALFIADLLIFIGVVCVVGKTFVAFWIVAYAFNVVVSFIIVNDDLNPFYKISWIACLILIPIFGGMIYIIYGRQKYTKKIEKRFKLIEEESLKFVNFEKVKSDIENLEIDAEHAQVVNWIWNVSSQVTCSNTKTEFFGTGEEFFSSVLEDIKSAEKYIFLEFYIVFPGELWGKIMNVLTEKAKNGVDVRLIFDDFGTISSIDSVWPDDFDKHMSKLGIKTKVFNPIRPRIKAFMNHRDHRKNVIIDGKVCYTGGVNLADEYVNKKIKFGYWQDCGIRLEGEATNRFTILFLNMWRFLSDEMVDYDNFIFSDWKKCDEGLVLPYGDNPLKSCHISSYIYLKMISQAKKNVYIQTPYFILNDELINALTYAAQGGVEVKVVTPFVADKSLIHAVSRSVYWKLIAAGVKIYEFTPGFVHSKVIVADEIVGVVGTANFNFRSLYLDFECGVWMYRTKAISQIYENFKNVFKLSHEVTLKDCEKIGIVEKFFKFILKPFTSFM